MEKDKLTYQELLDQIAELKEQNEILSLQSSIQNEEELDYDYMTILNNIGDPVFLKDEQSKLLIVNDAFCEMIGRSKADAIGKTLAEVVPPEEQESFLKIDKQVIADGVENINEESLTISGVATRIISTRKRRFIDSDGKKFLVGVIHDITERKKAENALKESKKQLIELNATKDKLFSIIAHDLRNPFNNIIGISELLTENTEDLETTETKEYINIIKSQAKDTLILLDNLLNWAQSQTGQISFNPGKIILSDVMPKIIKLNTSLSKSKNISLNYCSLEKIEVYADENMLRTIMRNLISNAIKFTKLGGYININAVSRQEHVEISISDNGIGINKEKLTELFNISSNITTYGTANEKGSGLGLVLCKEFVEKHKGKIWVESEDGKGSDFKFILPLNNSYV
ncbi:PAS domain S-box-containing protein [Flavobacterium gillisiae]|uniref:histidine kinase n=1 Tax=Flavobacterium gillisiae TaxID=150146 RepID=A0A1H4AXP0_9FLAO|nr:PAS domain-containing sensor histidine kinase [Flavobacterium gillisiae]SEA40651.1 PAS domain S-box-containing protein [Flavobacterium gillisiae]